jgi:hypothetical protein
VSVDTRPPVVAGPSGLINRAGDPGSSSFGASPVGTRSARGPSRVPGL